ncbi:NAD(P)H-dependent flavin oxidoreductase [Halorientalis regularis]|uniref:Nitronate monooxygenase n=1 Tax=Halorientalis regularis TaxID=660518 RepID=A0A1G7N0D3_9EURY|nr:nitronate monooxygenase [Halorientalis regularis]SDF67377.1 nitronate monooxygenase [Halorientalis regularis]
MSTLRTPLCDRLGIDVPVVQAPIGSVSCPDLAAAVSEAGGLGTLAVTWLGLEATASVIEATRERTDRPFGVNLVLDPDTTVHATEDHLEVCLDAGAEVVSFSFGDAAPYVEQVHDAGGTVLQTVGSAEEAQTAVEAGVDVLVSQGWEAGGHVQSDVATMPLVPAVADVAGEDVPVIAAGGIADGRGLAAALALGADGAWLGTRFVAAAESQAHREYQQAVTAADAREAVRSELYDGGWPGQPHRTLENDTYAEWAEAGEPPTGERPGEGEEVARYGNGHPVERYDDDPPIADVEGAVDEMAMYAGQSVDLTDNVRPAADIVDELAREARERIESLSEFATGS